MTSADQPFKRPSTGNRAEEDGSIPSSDAPLDHDSVAEPRILDPEFHQSVWKPWHSLPGKDEEVGVEDPSPLGESSTSLPRLKLGRQLLWLAPVAVATAVMIALLVPSLLHPDPPGPLFSVVDLHTRPVVAWSAEYGDRCLPLDEDHAILSGKDKVWSLDLRSGETSWSVDLANRYSAVSCLPGSNLVAISDVTASSTVLSITLLDGTTGERVAGFSGDETVQVVPLGSNIGLVAPDHTLTSVTVDALDSPIWSRPLPGPIGRLENIWVRDIDVNTVQLLYSVFETLEEPSPQQSEIVSLASGEPPAWASITSPDAFFHQRVGDVILARTRSDTAENVTAFDMQGRTLWRQDDASPTVAGSRLFLSTQSRGTLGWSRLHEVDPQTGAAKGDESFEAAFNYCFTTADGRPVIVQEDALTLLDDNLRPLPAIPSTNLHFLIQGQNQIYLGENIDASGETKLLEMTAIDASNSEVLWNFELEWGQSVDQLGRHLVLVDDDGETVHGLRSSER